MDNLVKEKLGSHAQKGSKPRCHRMTQGTNEEVAKRLTSMISPWGEVSENDNWMPKGFVDLTEAQLDKSLLINDLELKSNLKHWWLSIANARASTPNFDIASTCKIRGQYGLLLVEAKAHKAELINEEKGKELHKGASENSIQNHKRIEVAISEASKALSDATSLTWDISVNSHYQMANRFAWAWKLAQLGFPVVLVYLGFLNATEMVPGAEDRQEDLLPTHKVWRDLVIAHSKNLFPSTVWDSCWNVYSQSLVPLIRSVEIPYDQKIEKFNIFGK